MEFKSVPFGYHGHCGVVREVSVCFRKPIVASCSSDRSVKIWNYLDLTLDVSKTFPDAPVSLSLHATGNFVLVGFSNAIRMFCVCADGLKMMWEVPMRSCQRVAFSNGGQFFVAACDCTLYLYDAWTQDLLGKVDAHNADVCRLLWADRDASLLSVGTDGLGIEWELVNNPIHFVVRQSDIAPNETMNDASGLDNSAAATAKRAAAVINSGELPYPMLFKQLRYFTTTNGITNTAEYFTLPAPPKDTVDQLAQKQKAEAAKTVEERLIDGSPPACMTLAFGTDGVLCASISGKDSDAQFVYQLTSEMTSAFLHASKNTLLTTTSTGNICSVRWPLLDADGLPLPNIDYVEYCGHRGNANNVVATRDGKNVISCGEDGCLILYEVTSRAEGYGPSKTPRSLKFGEMSSLDVMYTDTYTDDVLVGVEDYTERLQRMTWFK